PVPEWYDRDVERLRKKLEEIRNQCWALVTVALGATGLGFYLRGTPHSRPEVFTLIIIVLQISVALLGAMSSSMGWVDDAQLAQKLMERLRERLLIRNAAVLLMAAWLISVVVQTF